MGNDAAIGFAGSQGNFELNVFKPVIIHNFLHSVRLLASSCRSFTEHCATGIEVNRERVAYYVQNCLMLVTALAPIIGYDSAAKIAHYADVEGLSLEDAAVKLGFFGNAEEFGKAIDPRKMTQPG
jgi:fumarate hydratase class II